MERKVPNTNLGPSFMTDGEQKDNQTQWIRHFTSVDALFKILAEGFRFASPRNWQDKNDVYCVKRFEELQKKKLYILCFCKGVGNAYHWTAFGHHGVGSLCKGCYKNVPCNIQINTAVFEKEIQQQGMSLQDVIYYKTVSQDFNNIHQLPLLKRFGYRVEKETRIIVMRDSEDNSGVPNLKIPEKAIGGINILRTDNDLYKQIKQELINRFPFLKDKIKYNGTIDSPNWQSSVKQQINKLTNK